MADSASSTRFPSRYYVTPLKPCVSAPDSQPTQRRYHYLDVHPPAGSPHRATVLLLHGFPDTSFGWRNLLSPLALAGYRCIAPDLLGYGRSSAPRTNSAGAESRLAEYSARSMCDDLNGLLDYAKAGQGAEYGAPTARDGSGGRIIVVGHDWGGFLAWKVARWLPERVMGVSSLCVPYPPPTSQPMPVEMLIKALPNLGYQKFFDSAHSTKIIQDNVEHFLSLVFQAPGLFTRTSTSTSADAASWVQEGALESVLLSSQSDSDSQSAVSREALQGGSLLLGRAELEEYVKLFGKGGNGMEGPLSWYRTRQVNWEDERGTTTKSLPSTLPALLLMATHDAALPPSMARSTPQYVPSVKIVRLQGAGHWVQLELPGVVSLNLERWIEEEVLSKGDAGKGKGKGKGMGMGAWVRAKI